MIQRIQSIYLLLGAAALLGIIPFRYALGEVSPAWALPAGIGVAGLAVLLGIVSIFLYANRKQQRKIVMAAQMTTLLVILIAFAGIYFLVGFESLTADTGRMLILGLPVLAYVLFFLARRAIDKDISLVRSMDRLR